MESHGLIKVTDDSKESKYRRVAKFLTIIGVDEASRVISLLPQHMVDHILPEIATIREISPEERESVMTEFHSLLESSRQQGGVQTAKEILEKAYGPEKAQTVFDKAVPFKEGKPFAFLEHEESEKISLVLKNESDYIRSVVISYLPSQLAAQVISRMSEDEKKETMLRLVRLQNIDPDTLVRIDSAIREKIQTVEVQKTTDLNGPNVLAEILKHMSPEKESAVLDTLSETDPELSHTLHEKLFTLADVEQCRGRFLQEYLRTMTERDIAVLIAAKPESFRTVILQNVSMGRGDIILEEEQLIVPVRKTDSDSVTARFMSAMRAAWERGDLYIPGHDDEMLV